LPAGGAGLSLKPFPNVPRTIGTVISHQFATLHELQTVYGVRDMLDFLEIIAVDACNSRRIRSSAKRR
jgi:hypothetical protein